VVRWEPTAAGALPLTLGFRGVDGVAEVVVDIGVGEPPVWIAVLPECGCDACDDGSARLLTELDDVVEHVVAGHLVHVDTGDGHVQTTANGWSASNLPDAEQVLAAARGGESTDRVTAGARWL
jgi:hypothetical protein